MTSECLPSASDWLRYKAEIRQLYLAEDLSLEMLVTELQRRGLPVASKHQLEHKLKQWGFQKNLSTQAWRSVIHRVNKRKGRPSGVAVAGSRLKASTIARAMQRYQQPTIRHLSAPPSPQQFAVTVYTPAQHPMEFSWPCSLPWLRFTSHKANIFDISSVRHRGDSRIGLRDEAHAGILGFPTRGGTQTIATSLGSIMPEAYDGEHFARADVLGKGSTREALQEQIAILAFRLSNDLADHANTNWGAIKDIIHDFCLTDSVIQLNEDSAISTTLFSFAENLFRRAVQELTWKEDAATANIIKWLLNSGVDPNRVCFRGKTPLEIAIDRRSPTLLKILIEHQVDVTHMPLNVTRTPVETILDYLCGRLNGPTDNEKTTARDMITLLIAAGSPISSPARTSAVSLGNKVKSGVKPAIHCACELADPDLVQLLVRSGADISEKLIPDTGILAEQNVVVSVAGSVCRDDKHRRDQLATLQYVLREIKQRFGPLPGDFVTADAFLAATMAGNKTVIEFLHRSCPAVSLTNSFGITPLHVLCSDLFCLRVGSLTLTRDEERNMCEVLAEWRVSMNATSEAPIAPLYLAAWMHRESIVEWLLDSEADLHIRFKTPRKYSKRKWQALKKLFCMDDNVSHLMGSFPDDLPRSPLAAALTRHAYDNSAALLIEKGAPLEGFEVTMAAKWRNFRLLDAVLDAGGDANEVDETGTSALQLALAPNQYDDEYGDGAYLKRAVETIELLLDAGANVVGKDVALGLRLSIDNQDLIDRLVEVGGCVRHEVVPGKMSALEAAILSHNPRVLKRTLLDVKAPYDSGALCAAITRAVQRNSDTLIQTLLNRRQTHFNSNADELEMTAIAIAAFHQHKELLQLLLTHLGPGSSQLARLPLCKIDEWSINRTWSFEIESGSPWWHGCLEEAYVKASPLAVAVKGGSLGIVSSLILHGFVPDETSMLTAVKLNSLECATALLMNDGKAFPDCQSGRVLLPAIRHDNIDMVQVLIQAGINVNGVSETEGARSPLQLAVELNRLAIMDMLLDAGADVNGEIAVDGGATALQIAAIQGFIGLAKRLIDLGADVNAPRAEQRERTALEGAAEHGRIDVLALLLSCGVTTERDMGRQQFIRAIQFATREGHHVAADLLRKSRTWTKRDDELMSFDLLKNDEDLGDFDFSEDSGSPEGVSFDFDFNESEHVLGLFNDNEITFEPGGGDGSNVAGAEVLSGNIGVSFDQQLTFEELENHLFDLDNFENFI